ncbi:MULTISPECIES: signal peptidase I [Halorubrum]|uniref:Peptidase S26B, signal peptidase n=1 Tax=Halorubrum hochstenium ATCC 700873 TaxID=1227481 RepID=M0FDN0_9EURY|nr:MULTISPECIES: signal peptidase I [Halorubrum]ELZ58030.1 peptidase S26B, signal peptidase [Halorubrum hochstenium ATCC 700873]
MTNPLTAPRTKRAANVLGIVLLIALIAPFAVFAAPEIVGADESFVVLTASMTPAIAPGDVVIVADRDPTAIAEGDVITFVRGTSDVPVTHRVIDVVDEGGVLTFETMGDANEGPDPGLVPAGNLVGVVALTIPYIGYVIQFAGTDAGFVAVVLLPFGLLAATEVWSIVRGRDEPEERPTTTAGSAGGEAGTAAGVAAVDADPVPVGTAASGSGGVPVDAVGGAAAVLAVVAPYTAYVAFELRSAVAIAAATAAATLLFGALATWVPASGVLDRGDPTAAPADESADSPAAHGGGAAGGAEAKQTDTEADDAGAEAEETNEADGEAVAADAERAAPKDSASASTPPVRPDAAGEVD